MKCIVNPVSILHIYGLEVNENLCYETFPDEILDRQVKKLWKKMFSR